jgi:hypothetical protein
MGNTQKDNREMFVLEQLASRLDAIGIPYMITGSIALHFYAVPRMTRDIDIVVEISEQHVDALVEHFSADCYLDADMIRNAIRNESMFNFIYTTMFMKIDFVVRKSSPYRICEFQRRRQIHRDGIDFSVVSPEDLVLSKLYWARDSRSEIQLKDVRGIIRHLDGLDYDYMHKWAVELGIEELYEEAKHE